MHSFDEFSDYVYDVSWSPTHPAQFATVDGTGRLSIFNLNQSESPVATDEIPTKKALNKVKWSVDGRRTAVGSNDGTVYIYDVGMVKNVNLGYSSKTRRLEYFSNGFTRVCF